MSMRIVAALVALIFSAGVAAAADCGPDKLGTARVANRSARRAGSKWA